MNKPEAKRINFWQRSASVSKSAKSKDSTTTEDSHERNRNLRNGFLRNGFLLVAFVPWLNPLVACLVLLVASVSVFFGFIVKE